MKMQLGSDGVGKELFEGSTHVLDREVYSNMVDWLTVLMMHNKEGVWYVEAHKFGENEESAGTIVRASTGDDLLKQIIPKEGGTKLRVSTYRKYGFAIEDLWSPVKVRSIYYLVPFDEKIKSMIAPNMARSAEHFGIPLWTGAQ